MDWPCREGEQRKDGATAEWVAGPFPALGKKKIIRKRIEEGNQGFGVWTC